MMLMGQLTEEGQRDKISVWYQPAQLQRQTITVCKIK